MSRVAVFIDGNNVYRSFKDAGSPVRVDFGLMADWLVRRVGGTSLWGVYYYTGVDSADSHSAEQQRLRSFLDELELLPGFFVHRFERKSRILRCDECGHEITLSHEKEVDTSMVAAMLRLAAVNAFDVAVLLSGDADLTPAVEGVRALGKQVYVATWGGSGLSRRIRRAAFDHVDLLEGTEAFRRENGNEVRREDGLDGAFEDRDVGVDRPSPRDDAAQDRAFLAALEAAETRFGPEGYVGVNYFLKSWRYEGLDEEKESRQRALDRLVDAERVELYEAEDGARALRRCEPGPAED